MSGYTNSTILIVTAADRDASNRIFCALGYDTLPGNTFSVKLSANGLEPPTHFLAHTWELDGYIQMLKDIKKGVLPPVDWAAFDLTQNQARQTGQRAYVRVQEVGSRVDYNAIVQENMAAALAELSVQRILPPPMGP